MSNKRNEYEICRDILEEAQNKIVKTKLLHRANLNVKRISKYLKFLIEHGFLETFDDDSLGHKVYKTTQEGKELVKKINEISEELKMLKEKS
jgi:predicted transcriptional regulator